MNDMLPAKPVDNCILFVEKLIRDRRLSGYETSKCFIEGLMLGLEAGVRYGNGQFEINMLEAPMETNTDEETDTNNDT